MTGNIGCLLPSTSPLRYDDVVNVSLRTLDVYLAIVQSDTVLRDFAKLLAKPMGYKPHAPDALVYGQVLPQDIDSNPLYLSFHADKDNSVKNIPKMSNVELISVHLTYKMRPTGRIPSALMARRKRGRTIEWFESALASVAGRAIVRTEARLLLKNGRRSQPVPNIRPVAGMKCNGMSYRSDKIEVGKLYEFRWRDRRLDNETDVWISCVDGMEKLKPGFWKREEGRCRERLRVLI